MLNADEGPVRNFFNYCEHQTRLWQKSGFGCQIIYNGLPIEDP